MLRSSSLVDPKVAPLVSSALFARVRHLSVCLSGTQIHPSCRAGVFVDQCAESVASVELVWRVRTDEP
jgi:hypothetical protein